MGNRMTGWVNGEKVLEWEDPDNTWESGCVGVGVRDGRSMFFSALLRPESCGVVNRAESTDERKAQT